MQSLHVRRLLLVILLVIMVGPLTAGSTATLPPIRSVSAIATLIGDYLATHPTVKRALHSGGISVTLISCGAGTGPGDLGPSADYELWVDLSGRPVRYVLSAKTRTETTFSDWGTCVLDAPPSERVRELEG
ncbi:hypothetical protein [Microbispora sp. GKU 823]|uniref:hypothetical protein n=1 Tax=Microbispora sp. GKU 823 TaxID=1652100 RepID=UPI0009A46619|nr:hypothetical protein [Microbispora sp. GKU 823]OPG02153.1 hypothetical protein B1L11_43085 [Microbispora sp. GKU 823]